MKMLVCYSWPGNVRQMENTIQRSVILCQGKTLRPEHISSLEMSPGEDIPRTMLELKEKKTCDQSVEDIEKTFVMEALKRNSRTYHVHLDGHAKDKFSCAAQEVPLIEEHCGTTLKNHPDLTHSIHTLWLRIWRN
jgi:transcriptional regulator with AAA-type ATPase domain